MQRVDTSAPRCPRPLRAAEQTYQANATLAGWLGLQPLQSLHMPVPLNILFLGFAVRGRGERGQQQHSMPQTFTQQQQAVTPGDCC